MGMLTRTLTLLLSFAITCSSSSAWPQVAGTANEGYKTKEDRERVARGLAGPMRDANQKPEAVVAALELKLGMTVADIGTGIGYMIPYLSRAVGPGGKVLAEDIHADFLDQARAKIAADGLTNVSVILGSETDPQLPPDAVDVAFILDTYHHFDYPEKMLACIRTSLKARGRLVIAEYHQNQVPAGHIRLDGAGVTKEVEANGFRLTSKNDHITNQQYMLIFEKRE
jgi:ubiquinone/menaquinone biosynthesis C-methylase UbiE